MLSYWEQQSFINYDYIIIGAGIVGLSAAIELKDKHNNKSVLVLERGFVSSGASTRNAGFAATGSLTELLSDLHNATREEIVSLFHKRMKGLQALRARLGDANIGYRNNGSHELLLKHELDAIHKIDEINELLFPVAEKKIFLEASEKIPALGLDSNIVCGLIENVSEGELHTGNMMKSLMLLAMQKGVEIRTGINVIEVEESTNCVKVFFNDVYRKDRIAFRCNQLSICTNAFTKQFLPDVDIIPGRGQVIVTSPIDNLKLKGIFHFDEGYYYFREIDGRVLLGGGRNKDFETESTTEFGSNELIYKDILDKLHTIIIPHCDHVMIDYSWSGIMAFGNNKLPIVKRFSNCVSGAFRLGGIGVALGTEVAKELVSIVDE